ncbi:MAG: hypothetical protein QM534_13660 [Sediminibacterium sp.]|nr:hypothetical protein [Sediminibacterium sp.]
MSAFIRLTLLTIGMIVVLGLYFEYCVNRPLNIYLQYGISAVVIVVTVWFLVYLVKQIIKFLNP